MKIPTYQQSMYGHRWSEHWYLQKVNLKKINKLNCELHTYTHIKRGGDGPVVAVAATAFGVRLPHII